MPPRHPETPQKTPRGSRRPPRKSANSTPSHIPSAQNHADVSVNGEESDGPKRILRRADRDTASDFNVVGKLELPNPAPPPRPKSMYDGFSAGQFQGSQSASDTNQQRKKGRRSQGGVKRASGVQRPDQNEAPILTPSQSSLTPNRPNVTPVKAYAGPTFHASPAASSLPIPKFLSRSVPNVDKTSSLKAMMQQEAVETTSESDNSPSLEKSQPTQENGAREASPLDIFFQADRADKDSKAKGQSGDLAGSNGLRSESKNGFRHHSRQLTDNSLGGLFPLEMDGANPRTPDGTVDNEPFTPAPKPMTKVDYKDDQRKAQTLELQKLLYSPKPQRGVSCSPRFDSPSQSLSPPAPKNTFHDDAPRLVPDGINREQQQHAALLALVQKKISGMENNNGSAVQRPRSSKLWKEMSLSSPSKQPSEAPSTPTQPRLQKISDPANGHTHQQRNDDTSSHSPFPSAFSPPAKTLGELPSTPLRHPKDAKSIEEDLRRILKLDVIGGDAVTDVRS